MKPRFTKSRLIALPLIVTLAGACAHAADSISINFNSGAGAVTTAGKISGAIPVAGNLWNNASGGSNTLGSLKDSNGATTAAGVTWTTTTTYTSASTGATATSENGALTKGYLDDGGAGWTATITNNPYLLSNIYAIHATDQTQGSAVMSAVSVNGTFYKGNGAGGTVLASGISDSWAAASFSTADALIESTNYIKVLNQGAVALAGFSSSPGRSALAGLQIEDAYAGTLAYWDIDGATPGAGGATPSGNWGDANWSADATGSAATGAWTSGNAAVFAAGSDATGTYTVTLAGTETADAVWVQENAAVTITGGTLDLGSTGLLRADGTSSIVLASALSGTGVNTAGAVTLGNTNTYTGATNVVSGSLTVSGGDSIPDASAVTLVGTLTLGASETIGTLAGGGGVSLAANTLTLGTAASTSYSGVISGTGGLVKQGAGTQALSAKSTYTGGTTINNGVLNLTGGGGASGTIRGAVTVNTGGTLRLSTGDATGYAGGASSLNSISLTGGTLDVNTTANQTLGSATLNMTGGSITGVAGSNIDLFNNGCTVNTFASATASTISLPTMNLRQDNTLFTIADGSAANDLLISSVLGNASQGNHAMIKAGLGTMKLTGLNVFTGNVTVNAGVLDLTGGGLYVSAFNSGNIVTVNTGGTLKLNSFGYSATASLGQLRDYAGNRVIDGGTIEITSGSESTGNDFTVGTNGGVFHYNPAVTTNTLTLAGNGNTNIPIAGALTLQADGNISIAEIIEGAGSITKTGAGSLTLSGANTYGGSTTINSGTLTVSGAGQLGGGSYAGAINNGGTLAFSSSANQTLSGIISGVGALTKSGSGTLTLSGANDYTGPTSVSGGSLAVTGELDAASAVSVTAGGTLLGTGLIHGDVTIADGGALTGVNDTSNLSLSMGSLTFDAAATVNIGGILDNHTSPAPLETVGNLTLNGGLGAVTLNLPTAPIAAGTYHLISSANTLADTSAFTLGTIPALGNRQTGSLVINSGFVDYTVSGINPSWTGDESGEWSTAILPGLKNWVTSGPTDYIDGDVVTFDDTATGTTAITLATTVTPTTVFFDNSTLNYSVSGAGGIAGATTTLTKTGTGSLTLNTANTYGGGTVLNDGALILGNASALSSGPVTLGGGSLGGTGTVSGVVSGGALLIDAAGGPITLSGVNTYTGPTTISAGTLEIGGAGQLGSGTYAGAITDNGTLSFNSSAAQTLSAAISGTGSLVKNGAGTLTLTANEPLSGGITVNGGTLRVSAYNFGGRFSPSTITVNSGGTLNGVGVHAMGFYQVVVLNGGIYNLSNEDYKQNLSMTDGVVNGPGELRLGYHGISTVTVSNSVLGSVINAPINNYSNNNIFDVSRGAATSDLTINGVVANGGGIVKNANGILSLTAANTYSGPTTINGGTLEINGAGQLGIGTYAAAIANAGNLVINSTASQTLSGVISGTGSLTKSNSGALTLSGVNTYTGNTAVNAGTLTLADNAQLKFVLGAASGVNNSLSGAGTAVLDGDFAIDTTAASALTSGTWTLENVPSLAGAYGATFTVVGFTDAGSDMWTLTDGSKLWTFDETTGVLILSASASYTSWIDGFTFAGGADKTPTGDPDNDGIDNAAEMVLGGNPATGMDAALAPMIQLVTTDLGAGSTNYLLFTFRRTDLSVTAGVTSNAQYGSTLSGWTTAVDGVGDVIVQVDDNFTFVPASPNTDRVRVYVPRGSNTKLFGRLNVTVP